MKVSAVCLGQPEKLPGKSYKSGINKQPVGYPVHVDENGLVGDSICNDKYHGGHEQAVYLEGSETLRWWAQELQRDLPPGIFGENIVIDGLENRDVCVGDRFHLAGGVILEATSPRVPCNTFTAHMNDPKIAKRYTAAARPGIYCRVIQTGVLAAGEDVEFYPYRGERVRIAELMIFQPKRLSIEQRSRYLSVPLHEDLQVKIRALA
ncbi:MOSC domain-containing protein [Rhizobium lemnae]|uniref:MOSC domain-containing protein n=1 Tax=Rhizobium lemnae TaxID=1214924 RepID=A0ABV8E6G8_9HYPH|nr:MOSC domain-containing protein [Rhizobium lemnae]MCJ8507664.1 MOSC domain-containing protein [Rhizobium lemnae]